MQDLYVGDIGDYGKYGLLRKVVASGFNLAINWYKVEPQKQGKQKDGKFIEYLSFPQQYRAYDEVLFDELRKIVMEESDRTITRIESAGILEAKFFSDTLTDERKKWHQKALKYTDKADIVFLDPDNGLETKAMHDGGRATEKHVCWYELKDYYHRGQSVILYQHRPQFTKKDACINQVLEFNEKYLEADAVYILEFPRYTNRFYFFFVHKEQQDKIKDICEWMHLNWKGVCNQVNV